MYSVSSMFVCPSRIALAIFPAYPTVMRHINCQKQIISLLFEFKKIIQNGTKL